MSTIQISSLIVSLIVWNAVVRANDTEVSSYGGELRPLKQTKIRMQYEMVVVDCRPDNVKVTVKYRFWNPTDSIKTTLAFVMPNTQMWEEEIDSYERNFSATINGVQVKYSKRRFEKGAFTTFKKSPYSDFAFSFNAEFKHGLNVIEHSYISDYSGTLTRMYPWWIDYILTSGTNWAGGVIDTIEAEVKMNGTALMSVRPFETENGLIRWKANGDVVELNRTDKFIKVRPRKDDTSAYFYFYADKEQEFWIRNGYLSFSATNFKPKSEITAQFERLDSADRSIGLGYLSIWDKFTIRRLESWTNIPPDMLQALLRDFINSQEYYEKTSYTELFEGAKKIVAYLKKRIKSESSNK